MKQPVNIVGGFYRDDSLPWSAQDCVNWLPVPAERPDTRTPSKLRTPPGLRPLVEIGNSPIRGMENVEGALYVVSGTTLYRISTTGVAIPMGTIPGVGPVTMSYNQQGIGNQVLITNGSSSGYVLDTASDTLTPISDDGYPGAIASDYIDSYLVQVEPFGRYWFWSNLADATDYNTLDRAEAEASPDKIVGLAVNQFEVVIFGQRTIEFFWNTGAATGTFQSKRVMANRGCASGRTIAKLGDALVWLGDDGIVYTLAGYQAVPLSTRALNDAIAGFNWSQAFAFVWEDRGHQVYYLTFPDGLTFGFDAASKEWHRRASFGMDRWRPNAVAKWNGQWVAGDFQAGRLYALDWEYMLEGADSIVSERVTGVLAAAQDAVGIPEAEFLFDTGRGHETVPVAFPEQPDGPSISGEAPDGLSSDAYSFSYTTTAGDAPIARTVLRDTTLPDGWAWDESTATISHTGTPVPTGTISLSMRVYDTNGLYADHTDEFMVVQESVLLISGNPSTEGGPLLTAGIALEPITLTGIAQSTGADLANGIPAYSNGIWAVATIDGIRYSLDDRATWLTGTVSLTGAAGSTPRCFAAGPDGWVVNGVNASGPNYFAISGPTPETFAPHPTGIKYRINGGSLQNLPNPGNFRYVAGKWWTCGGSTGLNAGAWLTAPTLATEEWINVGGQRDYATYWYDICEWGGALWATCRDDDTIDSGDYKLKKSTDGGDSWVEVFRVKGSPSGLRPWQLEAGSDVLLCLSYGGGHVYTSEDNFTQAHATGISTSMTATIVQEEQVGRLIRFSAGRFFLVSGANSDSTRANKCVSTLDGLTFTDPVNHEIVSAKGITVGEPS